MSCAVLISPSLNRVGIFISRKKSTLELHYASITRLFSDLQTLQNSSKVAQQEDREISSASAHDVFFIIQFEDIMIFCNSVPVFDFKIEIVKFTCHIFFQSAYLRGATIMIYTMTKADFRNTIPFSYHQ